ncbi:putative serine/threonine-protein kinase iks1 [Rhodotorula kratochvilovae]
MSSSAPAAPPDPPDGDHTHWQVVLSDPSSRKLVLYSPLLRRLAVQSTPPSSRRGSVRRAGWALPPSERADRHARERSRGGEGAAASPPSPTLSSASSRSDNGGADERVDDSTPDGTAGPPPSVCPLCFQALPRGPSPGSGSRRRRRRRSNGAGRGWLLPSPGAELELDEGAEADEADSARWDEDSAAGRTLETGQSYFDLLSEVNSLAPSAASTAPRALPTPADARGAGGAGERLDQGQMNEGYFSRFFEELQLLGKGGQGSVFLVRHVLNGEALGLYACKKIAVGDSTPSLLSILREVHLLESATHANITRYHHAWLETSSPRSAFAPPVPTLHVLMEFANGGSLQGFVDARKGAAAEGEGAEGARRRRRQGRERAVHLLGVEDVLRLFEDVVEGLAFLHGRNILHLDMKAENVLLHWDDDALLPTCKLSDFGNATSDSYHAERRGGSGTLLYTPPEAFFPSPLTGHLPPPDRATDMWALGLILHLLCFFALPYATAEGNDTRAMEDEVKRYGGALIHRSPARRPTCERVRRAIEGVRAEMARGGWERGREDGEEVGAPLLAGGEGTGAGAEVEEVEEVEREHGDWRLSPPLQVTGELCGAEEETPAQARAWRDGDESGTVGRAIAILAALIKLLLLSRATALVPYSPSSALPSAAVAPSIPLTIAALLVLETALDVALAQPRWTAVIALVHVVLLRWL